jgi:hypothetical protein
MGAMTAVSIGIFGLLAGGLVGWSLGSLVLTIRAIEDSDVWPDDDELA